MVAGRRELEHVETLAASADFVVPDPPYNIRHVLDVVKGNHDLFASSDRKVMSTLCREMLQPGAHASIFSRVFVVWGVGVIKSTFQGGLCTRGAAWFHSYFDRQGKQK